jgi:hypothetical protein
MKGGPPVRYIFSPAIHQQQRKHTHTHTLTHIHTHIHIPPSPPTLTHTHTLTNDGDGQDKEEEPHVVHNLPHGADKGPRMPKAPQVGQQLEPQEQATQG